MSPVVSGCEGGWGAPVCLPFFFPVGAGLYILQLMSERLAPSARGGLSLSDGFPVSICQVRLCTARRSPLLSPGYLLPLSPAGSAAAPGPLPTTAQRRGPRQGGSRRTMRRRGMDVKCILRKDGISGLLSSRTRLQYTACIVRRLKTDLRKAKSEMVSILF